MGVVWRLGNQSKKSLWLRFLLLFDSIYCMLAHKRKKKLNKHLRNIHPNNSYRIIKTVRIDRSTKNTAIIIVSL